MSLGNYYKYKLFFKFSSRISRSRELIYQKLLCYIDNYIFLFHKICKISSFQKKQSNIEIFQHPEIKS
jgi:hypothetical protein